jgi:CBS domain-containing protein
MARYERDFGGQGGGRGEWGRPTSASEWVRAGMSRMGGHSPGADGRQAEPVDFASVPRAAGGPPGLGGPAALRMRAADIMTADPSAVTPQSTLADAARRMAELDVGIMPVVDNAESFHLLGVVTDRDLAVRGLARGKDGGAPVADCMTTQVASVQPASTVREVFDLMKRERIRRVPVTDRGGRLVGIIAQADLAVHYAGLDGEREREVEEVIERISEPGRREWRG